MRYFHLLALAAVTFGAAAPAHARDMSPELLLSSAWCTFSYNKVSGASRSKRVTFSPNGSWSMGGRAESYSSGRAGSVAGQTDSGGGGQWRVQNGELFMSEGGQLEHVQTVLRRNSNGYPVIVADGIEYSQCR